MADVKNSDRIRINPYAKHIFTTNTLPQSKDTSDGYYRRLNILIFDNKFEVGNSNFNREVFYQQENLDYLGNRALREYLKLFKTGRLILANEEESQQELEKYRKMNDTIFGFITDCNFIYGSNIKTTDMYQYYINYCSDLWVTSVGKQQFYNELQNKYGFVKKLIDGYEHFYKANPLT